MEPLPETTERKITKPLANIENPVRLISGVAVVAITLGIVTGYILTNRNNSSKLSPLSAGSAKTPQQDSRTFRDFAEGTITAKPAPANPGEYAEGTHFLIRPGAASVALTSSVVDLSKYEGKKVKVFGETQKAIKEGWLMDIGKIEEVK